jgi:hypothetical protein
MAAWKGIDKGAVMILAVVQWDAMQFTFREPSLSAGPIILLNVNWSTGGSK